MPSLTFYVANETISGIMAVALASGAFDRVVVAQAGSGLRMPAFGVSFQSVVSGQQVGIAEFGQRVPLPDVDSASWSGVWATRIYVGSGGKLIVGSELASGMIRQELGISSDGIVNLGKLDILLGSGHFPSGIIGDVSLQSGSISWETLANSTIYSGHIVAGTIASPHLASGAVGSGRLSVGGTPDGSKFLRDDFTWASTAGGLASGSVQSGHVGDASVVSGSFASGSISRFAVASGSLLGFELGSGSIVSGRIASGSVGRTHLADGSVLSGHVAAVSLASPHLASGAVTSGKLGVGETPDGSKFLRDDFTWQVAGAGLSSGSVQSGHVGNSAVVSGSVASGQLGRFHVASGQFLGFELGSGAIVSGRVASGQVGFGHLADASVQSGTIASGIIGPVHLADASVQSGEIASGQVGGIHLASGAVQSGHIGNNAAVSGSYASGSISRFAVASGSFLGFELGSGAIVSGRIASGQVGKFHIASGAVGSGQLAATGVPDGTKVLRDDFIWAAPGSPTINSGDIRSGHIDNAAIVSGSMASGHISTYHFSSGTIAENRYSALFVSGKNLFPIITEELISGVRAVQVSHSGTLRIAMAAVSGRMPAVGVVFDNAASGIECTVYTDGVFQLPSGMANFSGWVGRAAWVGRSGQLVQWSGSWNSGGFVVTSGTDYYQRMGLILNSGAVALNVAPGASQFQADLNPGVTDSMARRFGF